MSRQKWTLTQAEQAEYRKRVERLRAAGADLDVSGFKPVNQDWIKITHDRVACVHALPTGSLFEIPARIVALAPKVIIQGFELWSSAFDLAAWFLEDPTVNRSDDQRYRLRNGTDFHRTEVLNHRVDAAGKLRCGEVMEGTLLAESFDAIPVGFADDSVIPICLSIINQFDDVHSSTTEARIKRTAELIRPRPLRRSTLFDREDGSCGSPEWVDAPDGLSLRNGQPATLGQAANPVVETAIPVRPPGPRGDRKGVVPKEVIKP